MRRIRSVGCCARAASGHVVAAPPRSLMNSRRLIRRPRGFGQHIVAALTCNGKGPAYVRFGSLADICSAKGHVRFAPNSDRESGFPQTVMSALPPKADMCSALANVRYGPIADIVEGFLRS